MIQIKNIKFAYNMDKSILQNISFKISDGDYIVIEGISGVGKSTFLNIVAGLLKPNEGTILIDDIDIYKMKKSKLYQYRSLNMGCLAQEINLIDSLTVLENICLPCFLHRNMKKEYISKNSLDILEYLNLEDYTSKYPRELSGGQKRRVELARLCLQNPKYIFADEPTANLDDANVKLVMNMFERMNSMGITVVVSSHDNRIFSEFNNKLLLKDGNIVV